MIKKETLTETQPTRPSWVVPPPPPATPWVPRFIRGASALLVQPQRVDGWLVDGSSHNQSLVALVVYQSGSRVDAEGPVYRAKVVTCFLQCTLNVCDHLIPHQITIGVDGSGVVVVAVIRIVSPCWIPIAGVQEVISACNKHNGIAMLFPPVAIVPFMPIATKSIRITKAILSRLTLQLLLVLLDLTVR